MNTARLRYRYAWPSADWGSLPVEGGIEAAYKAELAAAEDREATLRDIEERLERARSPFRTAETYWVEEIIDPARHPRPALRVRESGRAASRARPHPLHLPSVRSPRASEFDPRIHRTGAANPSGPPTPTTAAYRTGETPWTSNLLKTSPSGSPTLSTVTTSTA